MKTVLRRIRPSNGFLKCTHAFTSIHYSESDYSSCRGGGAKSFEDVFSMVVLFRIILEKFDQEGL